MQRSLLSVKSPQPKPQLEPQRLPAYLLLPLSQRRRFLQPVDLEFPCWLPALEDLSSCGEKGHKPKLRWGMWSFAAIIEFLLGTDPFVDDSQPPVIITNTVTSTVTVNNTITSTVTFTQTGTNETETITVGQDTITITTQNTETIILTGISII